MASRPLFINAGNGGEEQDTTFEASYPTYDASANSNGKDARKGVLQDRSNSTGDDVGALDLSVSLKELSLEPRTSTEGETDHAERCPKRDCREQVATMSQAGSLLTLKDLCKGFEWVGIIEVELRLAGKYLGNFEHLDPKGVANIIRDSLNYRHDGDHSHLQLESLVQRLQAECLEFQPDNPTAPMIKEDNGMVHLEKFELFPKLPKELRLQIWEVALPTQRAIEISALRDAISPVGHSEVVRIQAACKEAFEVVGTKYQTIHVAKGESVTRGSRYSKLVNTPERVFFVGANDTVYLSGGHMFRLLGCRQSLKAIRTLATTVEWPLEEIERRRKINDDEKWLGSNLGLIQRNVALKRLKGLRKLLFVVNADEDRFCGTPVRFEKNTTFEQEKRYTVAKFVADWLETLAEVEIDFVNAVREEPANSFSGAIAQVIEAEAGKKKARLGLMDPCTCSCHGAAGYNGLHHIMGRR